MKAGKLEPFYHGCIQVPPLFAPAVSAFDTDKGWRKHLSYTPSPDQCDTLTSILDRELILP